MFSDVNASFSEQLLPLAPLRRRRSDDERGAGLISHLFDLFFNTLETILTEEKDIRDKAFNEEIYWLYEQ